MIASSYIALMHYSWSIRLWELGLHHISYATISWSTLYTYDAVPQGSVVPQNDVLLLMSVSVDILWG